MPAQFRVGERRLQVCPLQRQGSPETGDTSAASLCAEALASVVFGVLVVRVGGWFRALASLCKALALSF